MIVEDFRGVVDTLSEAELEEALSKRYCPAEVNEFLLSHAGSKYPYMAILAKQDIAVVSYFPKDQVAGLISVGGKLGLDSDGINNFCMYESGEAIGISNKMVILFTLALQAAKEFSFSKRPPTCIEWLEL